MGKNEFGFEREKILSQGCVGWDHAVNQNVVHYKIYDIIISCDAFAERRSDEL